MSRALDSIALCTAHKVNPFDTHCCQMGTAIKHPVPDWVKPSFVIFDIWTLWRSARSVGVPTGCRKSCYILKVSEVDNRQVVRPSTVRQVITLHTMVTAGQCWQHWLQVTQSVTIKRKHEESRVGIDHTTGDVMECSLDMLHTDVDKTHPQYYQYQTLPQTVYCYGMPFIAMTSIDHIATLFSPS